MRKLGRQTCGKFVVKHALVRGVLVDDVNDVGAFDYEIGVENLSDDLSVEKSEPCVGTIRKILILVFGYL